MPDLIPAVDTHAHVFDVACHFVEGRRYTPGYDATVQRYTHVLDQAGVQHGVLVQPSFLGTDNTYLLAGLRAFPDRLRGIVVVAPEIPDTALEAMDAAGVRGLRYNLIGRDPALIGQSQYRALTQRVTALGWLIEVQTAGADLPRVLDTLTDDAAKVVVDHFGKPGLSEPKADPGFRKLMEFGPDGVVWVKLSAPYRLGGLDAAPYAAALHAHFGPQRLLWGSDGPWTQHEVATSYSECVAQISGWLPANPEHQARFDQTSRALYGFGARLAAPEVKISASVPKSRT
ncbi:MAG TPA: amidohydrolase family protein [Thermohalobaculum sp.]|nr:amidohydrolase family protein [Thermohalobaculum sp.]